MRRLTFKTPAGPLEYTVSHRSRVTKRLHMELDESGGLVVVAPGHWSSTFISSTLTQNTSRVERFLARARQRQLTPLQYTHGEQHLYLGETYPLAIQYSKSKKNRIELIDSEIHVNASMLQNDYIQTGLQNWYQRQAMTIFSARLQVISRCAPWVKDKKIPLKLRRMKRTWGSCSSRGVIKLNTHLVKAPLILIDSVIAHELCHLEEMNHDTRFYALLEGLNPDWRQDRARLRAQGFVYLLT
jgi:predicted metal-dependent hydrolase